MDRVRAKAMMPWAAKMKSSTLELFHAQVEESDFAVSTRVHDMDHSGRSALALNAKSAVADGRKKVCHPTAIILPGSQGHLAGLSLCRKGSN
jgi:hypothetical protein